MTVEKARAHIKTVDDHNKKEGERTEREYAEFQSALKALRDMYKREDPDAKRALKEAIMEFGKDRKERIDFLKLILNRSDHLTMEQMDFLGLENMLGKEEIINNERNTIAMRIGVKELPVDGIQYRGTALLSINPDTHNPELDIKIVAASTTDSPEEYNRDIKGIKLDENKPLYLQVKAHVDKIKAEPGMSDIFD